MTEGHAAFWGGRSGASQAWGRMASRLAAADAPDWGHWEAGFGPWGREGPFRGARGPVEETGVSPCLAVEFSPCGKRAAAGTGGGREAELARGGDAGDARPGSHLRALRTPSGTRNRAFRTSVGIAPPCDGEADSSG